MDLNDLCMTLVLVNCVWLLAMRPAWAWMGKAAAVLALLGGVWWWQPERAGLIAVGPWALLVMIPMWLQHWTVHLMQQRRLLLAQWTTGCLAILHPTAAGIPLRRMVRVLRDFSRGEVDRGLQLAQQAGLSDPGIRHLGLVIKTQMTGNWTEFESELESLPLRGLDDPNLLGGKVQAVAERRAWGELQCLCQFIGSAPFSTEQNVSLYLRTFAILGDVVAVRHLLLSSGHLLASESREFWTAVGEQASGADAAASDRLLKLRPRASAALRPMVERRLAMPAVGPSDLEVRDRALAELNAIRSTIEHDAKYAVLAGGIRRWPVMTLALIVVMLAVYLREIPGGSEDTENLESLGAMVVPMTGEPGEWTHIFTSGFLHFGPIHLALNLLGLLFLGRLVERAWGPIRMLLQFLVCIVASAGLLPWLTFLDPGETAVFAGASGGIMGLLGGLWGHLLVGWFTRKTPLVRRQFRTACSLIVLQSVCDLMTPQVSMTCHLIGLFTGMIGGIAVGLCGGRR